MYQCCEGETHPIPDGVICQHGKLHVALESLWHGVRRGLVSAKFWCASLLYGCAINAAEGYPHNHLQQEEASPFHCLNRTEQMLFWHKVEV